MPGRRLARRDRSLAGAPGDGAGEEGGMRWQAVLKHAGHAVVVLVDGVLAALPGAAVEIQPDVGALELEGEVVVDLPGIGG